MIQRYIVLIFIIIFSNKTHASEIPTIEHQVLKQDEGAWQAHLSFYQHGQVSKQLLWHETNVMLGELFSVGKLEGALNGEHYKGYATLGFNPDKKQFEGTWVDVVSPEIVQMVGQYNAELKTLTLFYQVTTNSGVKQRRKNVMHYVSANRRDFVMYILQQEQWVKAMHIDYRKTDNLKNGDSALFVKGCRQ